jgi:hypothetical protein
VLVDAVRLDDLDVDEAGVGEVPGVLVTRVTEITTCPDPSSPCGVGIAVAAGADNVVEANHVARVLADGVAVVAFGPQDTTSGTVVRANLVRAAQNDDYSVGALGEGTLTGTLLTGNLALGAGDDGFDIHVPGTTLSRNAAFHNADLGVDAVAGTIDGGGNKAHGNGNPAQCAACRATSAQALAPAARPGRRRFAVRE